MGWFEFLALWNNLGVKYKLAIWCFLAVYIGISHLYSLGVYTRKIQVTQEKALRKCCMARDISPYNLNNSKLYSLFWDCLQSGIEGDKQRFQGLGFIEEVLLSSIHSAFFSRCFYWRILTRLTHFAISGSIERHTTLLTTRFFGVNFSLNHGFRASNLACVLSLTLRTVFRK